MLGPRLLVAIESCARDMAEGCHTAIRETWGKDFADVRFFVGNGAPVTAPDEIALDAPDDYDGLPKKTKALATWVVEQRYDFVYKCDVDTFVRADRLLACGWQAADYTGRFTGGGGGRYDGRQMIRFYDVRLGRIGPVWPWASGGIGYFLSKRAARHVANMPLVHWAEDLCVGQVLGPLVLRRQLRSLNPYMDGYATWHFCRTGSHKQAVKFAPQWQYDSYAKGQPQQ